MKLYLLCVDAFPLTNPLKKIATDNNFKQLPFVTNGAFTTATLGSIFSGCIGSDVIPNGIAYHSWKKKSFYEWRDKYPDLPLANKINELGYKIIIHNNTSWMARHLVGINWDADTSNYRHDINKTEQSIKNSKYNYVEFTNSNPEDKYAAFLKYNKTTLCNKFYQNEEQNIKKVQSSSDNLFFFTDLCHWHEAVYHSNYSRSDANKKSIEWLKMWDFNEPDAMFIIFADHGYQVETTTPPKDYLTWCFIKDNTENPIKINRNILSSCDLYKTMLEKLGCNEFNDIIMSQSVTEPDNNEYRNRVYYLEDARGNESPTKCVNATAIKITEWANDYPKELLQCTYIAKGKRIIFYSLTFDNNTYNSYKYQKVRFNGSNKQMTGLLNNICERFNWLTESDINYIHDYQKPRTIVQNNKTLSVYTDSPYKKMPEELKSAFTMNNTIPIYNWWFDGRSTLKKKNDVWNNKYIESFTSRFTAENILKNKQGKESYPGASKLLLTAFTEYNITELNIAVIGSTSPWIEAILLNLGNKVTTIEYNVPKSECDIICKSYWDFEKTTDQYDCIVTFSSIEHSGLGRYGDPLDPDGDIKTMDVIHNNLKCNGLLFWGAPVGKDAITWNAHRVYGEKRLRLMFDKYKELQWFGCSRNDMKKMKPMNNGYQPVIVLQKE